MNHSSPIPTILVTGWLGAGKTTLIRHLLDKQQLGRRRLAVVINEFGSLGVDGELLPAGDYRKYEINKGSLFCICTKTDLLAVFSQIREQVQPEFVLVEATGLAQPRDLSSVLGMPMLADGFTVSAVVCMIDPLTFLKIEPMASVARAQVEAADLLAINKCDLVDPVCLDQVERQVRTINKEASVIRVSHGRVDWHQLRNAGHSDRRLKRGPVTDPPRDVVSVSLVSDQPLDRVALYSQLDRWRNYVLRAKGLVCFGDSSALVELAGGRLTSRPGTFFADNNQTTTRFVVIARELGEDEIREGLQACVRDNRPT